MTDGVYVTGRKAAQMLGVHYNTILNMRKRGILTDVRIPTGSKNRPGQGKYLRSEIEALVAGVASDLATDPRLESSVAYALGRLPHYHGCAHQQEEALPCTCWKHQVRTLMLERLEENLSAEPAE